MCKGVCEGEAGHVYTTGREGHGRSFSNYLLTLERTGAFLSIRAVIIWEGGKKEGVMGGWGGGPGPGLGLGFIKRILNIIYNKNILRHR